MRTLSKPSTARCTLEHSTAFLLAEAQSAGCDGEAGGMRVPVNFRVVDKAEGKTKNDLFREMVSAVLGWGLAPAIVTADSWYSGVENLRFLRDQGLRFMIALEKNRTVSERQGEHLRVEDVDLPASGQAMYRRHFGWVSVFRTVDKKQRREALRRL